MAVPEVRLLNRSHNFIVNLLMEGLECLLIF